MFVTNTYHGEVRLPDLTLIPVETIDQVMRSKPDQRIWSLLELASDSETIAVIDQLNSKMLDNVIAAWEKHDLLKIEALFSTYRLSRKYRDSLEADLINIGLRLRNCPSSGFTWRDLWLFIKHTPLTSNMARVMFPDKAGWTRENMLLAEVADSLHWLQWAKTKSGSKGRNKPKPIPRPGVTAPAREGSKPKASPVSVIKERFANRHRRVSDRETKIKDLFSRR